MLRIKKPLKQVVYTREGDHILASLLVEIEDDKNIGAVVVSKTISVKIHNSRPKKVKISRFKVLLREGISQFLANYEKETKFSVTFAEVQQSLESNA